MAGRKKQKKQVMLSLTPEFRERADEVWGQRRVSARMEELGRAAVGLPPLIDDHAAELARLSKLVGKPLCSIQEQRPSEQWVGARTITYFVDDLIRQDVPTSDGQLVGLPGETVVTVDALHPVDRGRIEG